LFNWDIANPIDPKASNRQARPPTIQRMVFDFRLNGERITIYSLAFAPAFALAPVFFLLYTLPIKRQLLPNQRLIIH
jgi:hypothetical protein